MTKGQFVKQGNKICQQIEKKRIEIANEAASKSPSGRALPPAQLERFVPSLLAAYRTSTEELAELDPPANDAALVARLIRSFEKSYAQAEKERRAVVLGTSTVFQKPDEMATKFGLTNCVM